MTVLQIKSLKNMIELHGVEKVIDFYLDVILESKYKHYTSYNYRYWTDALKYLSNKL